ncbi:hypothetical protein ACFX15_011046 [Malus domestica]
MYSLKCCRGFAAGGAIGFTGDQMVLRKGSVGILSGSTGVAGNGRADEFPAAAHALAITESEQNQRG